MPTNNLRRALNYGPTVAVRFFVAFAALLQALRFLLAHAGWLTPPDGTLASRYPLSVWGAAFATAGALGLWRTISHSPNPRWGWVANTATTLVWTAGLAARARIDPSTLMSAYTVIALMAVWCLLRTEATPLDTRDT